MPERMGADLFLKCELPDVPVKYFSDSSFREFFSPIIKKQIRAAGRRPGFQVGFDGFDGRFSYRNEPLLVSLTQNFDHAAPEIQVLLHDIDQFPYPDSRGIKELDYGPVAFPAEAGVIRSVEKNSDFVLFEITWDFPVPSRS